MEKIEPEYLEHIGFHIIEQDDESILFTHSNPARFRDFRYYPKSKKYCLCGGINMLTFIELFHIHSITFDQSDFKLFKRNRSIKKILNS